MKLSVLINNYNYARYLNQCIDSALDQDFPDVEVVVVDDGSTDDSREIIASYGAAITPVLKTNGGQASSFNAGFAVATGDVLFFLDADDAFLPGKLPKVAELFAGRDIDWCFDRVTTDPNAEPPDEIAVADIDKRAAMRRGKFPSIPVPTSGLAFRRPLLAQILPMPVASDVVLSDNYLKFAAAFLGRGALIEPPLTFQRLHEANRYTGASAGKALRPKIMVETGFQLARRYHGMADLGAQLVAGGLAERDLSFGAALNEIRHCTAGGTFGRLGTARIAARYLAKRLLGGVSRAAG
jgi:glycosyltransferase involved in cell wall biosynthesis